MFINYNLKRKVRRIWNCIERCVLFNLHLQINNLATIIRWLGMKKSSPILKTPHKIFVVVKDCSVTSHSRSQEQNISQKYPSPYNETLMFSGLTLSFFCKTYKTASQTCTKQRKSRACLDWRQIQLLPKRDHKGNSFQSSPKINRILIKWLLLFYSILICIQWKFTRIDQQTNNVEISSHYLGVCHLGGPSPSWSLPFDLRNAPLATCFFVIPNLHLLPHPVKAVTNGYMKHHCASRLPGSKGPRHLDFLWSAIIGKRTHWPWGQRWEKYISYLRFPSAATCPPTPPPPF